MIQKERRIQRKAMIDLTEYEDLANPKDELKKKIVAVASTIRNWHEDTMKARKSVREQLQEILDLGLNTYKMQRTELRKLVEEIFRYHGISESWLRKLLPEGLKDTSKIRISILQRQEIEKERQRLLQLPEQDLDPQQESIQPIETGTREIRFPFEYRSQNQEISSLSNPKSSNPKSPNNIRQILDEDTYKNKTEKLEADVRRLSEQFVTKVKLHTSTETFPLVAHVDPVKKKITWIRFDMGHGI